MIALWGVSGRDKVFIDCELVEFFISSSLSLFVFLTSLLLISDGFTFEFSLVIIHADAC